MTLGIFCFLFFFLIFPKEVTVGYAYCQVFFWFNSVPSEWNALPPALYLNVWTMNSVNSLCARGLNLALLVSFGFFQFWKPQSSCVSENVSSRRKRKLSCVDISWDTQIHWSLFSLTNFRAQEKLRPWLSQYNFYSGPLADGHWKGHMHLWAISRSWMSSICPGWHIWSPALAKFTHEQ